MWILIVSVVMNYHDKDTYQTDLVLSYVDPYTQLT